MSNRRQFRKFLLNPRYQLKFVLLAAGAGLILGLVNAGVFFRFAQENYAILVDLSPMTDDAKKQLYSELRTILLTMTGASLLFSCAAGFLALWLSHRTAGPLYRFSEVFRQIRSGNRAARVRLRPGDDFQDVAIEFNALMNFLVDAPSIPQSSPKSSDETAPSAANEEKRRNAA